MELSKNRKSLSLQINIWLKDDGQTIGVGSNEPDASAAGLIASIESDPTSPNGHKTLHRELMKILRSVGIAP